MSYPRRIQKPNLTYHVYSACINKENYLSSKRAKDMFLDVIRMAQEKYDFRLHAYQIMENHFHIVLMTLNAHDTVSSIVQYVKSVFARKLNMETGRSGPLWNRRFHDTIIETAREAFLYFLWVLWAIAYNPVRKGIIETLDFFSKYSSIGFYLEETFVSPLNMNLPDVFTGLGATFEERKKEFELYHHIFLPQLSGPDYQHFLPE